jgi:hypothetical protein
LSFSTSLQVDKQEGIWKATKTIGVWQKRIASVRNHLTVFAPLEIGTVDLVRN